MTLISGSNGGISKNYSKIDKVSIFNSTSTERLPKIVSFFVNNRCQLNCRHCYVSYKDDMYSLSVKEWERVF